MLNSKFLEHHGVYCFCIFGLFPLNLHRCSPGIIGKTGCQTFLLIEVPKWLVLIILIKSQVIIEFCTALNISPDLTRPYLIVLGGRAGLERMRRMQLLDQSEKTTYVHNISNLPIQTISTQDLVLRKQNASHHGPSSSLSSLFSSQPCCCHWKSKYNGSSSINTTIPLTYPSLEESHPFLISTANTIDTEAGFRNFSH